MNAAIPNCFSTTIRHLHFDNCLARLRQLVLTKSSTRLAIVTGPAGAGKTKLTHALCEELKAIAAPDMATNPVVVPFGLCNVKAPEARAFSWKDTYIQQLQSLRHPFAEMRSLQKSVPQLNDDPALKTISPDAAQRLSNDRLFRILQKTIRHRQPKAIIFDEAHHLLRVGSSQSLANQLEHLKYIADETHTLHVLIGTYELIRLMDLSSALIRRREVVHLPRYVYDANNPEASLEDFAKVVAEFARDLDSVCESDLLTEVPYLYQGSVGCVGILRDWLFRAYTGAKSSKRGMITKAVLAETELASSDKLELLKDIHRGECYFEKRSLCESEYLSLLGFHKTPSESSLSGQGPAEKRDSRKPFKRKPHNDVVGTDHLNLSAKKAS